MHPLPVSPLFSSFSQPQSISIHPPRFPRPKSRAILVIPIPPARSSPPPLSILLPPLHASGCARIISCTRTPMQFLSFCSARLGRLSAPSAVPEPVSRCLDSQRPANHGSPFASHRLPHWEISSMANQVASAQRLYNSRRPSLHSLPGDARPRSASAWFAGNIRVRCRLSFPVPTSPSSCFSC